MTKAAADKEPWMEHLIVTATGAPKALLANAMTALRDAPAWQGCLAYDEFSHQTTIVESPPWGTQLEWQERPWTPQDDLLVTDWLQHKGIAVNVATAAQAVEAVAKKNPFHPVREYLDSIEHDGKARLKTWLTDFAGAEPTGFNEHIGSKLLIAAVARAWDPGVQSRHGPNL
ncbi:VapE domain-containing protein [Bradyrhizobium sp. Tv2a-2]|uniref:VapE domain-containing protein n=1 Tax=Bradyrhizobium sp. Tv2a-2 TaxID=113395 RepID=UPI00040FAC44|nr:VapE domain-containing protein [Bradyrhizobium sp. Tv2a-2]